MYDYNRTCECEDGACQAYRHVTAAGRCAESVAKTLYRVDMDDHDGVRFCSGCADDASEAGVFATQRTAYSQHRA